MVLEEFSELYKKYAPKFQKDTKLKASTSKKITPQKIVLAPEQKTFSKIIKGKKLLTTMASLSENNVDVFKIFNEKDNLKQMVVSTGKYQTVFNYV